MENKNNFTLKFEIVFVEQKNIGNKISFVNFWHSVLTVDEQLNIKSVGELAANENLKFISVLSVRLIIIKAVKWNTSPLQ